MAFTPYQVLLSITMLFSGTCNTIVIKGINVLGFEHPFLQSLFMFAGEVVCLVVFHILLCSYSERAEPTVVTQLTEGNRNVNPFYMYVPALFDLCGSSAMYIGLTLTSSSTFQMLRGSVIIFVALFSIIFLGRRLLSREWYGIVMLFVGLLTVGFSDYWEKKHNSSAEKSVDDNSMQQMIMGDVIIVLAQIIVALQMVYQEKFVARFNIPALQAVGWEGFFGFLTTLILLWPLNYAYIPWENNQKLSDVPLAVKQIKGDWRILALIFASIFSISIFNFTGLSVTKEISATTRMVLDSLRTVLIWAFEMCMGWKGFQSLQLIGFIFLLFGTCLYNNMFVPEFCRDRPSPPLRRKMDAIHQPTIVGATIVSATRIDDD